MERESRDGFARAATPPRDDVFRQQAGLVASVGAVLLLVFALAPPSQDQLKPLFLTYGVIGLVVVSVAAAVVPWDRLDRRWQLLVPTLDVVAICLLRIAQPDAGFGIIMVIPVLWLASARGRLGVALGSAVPAVVLLSQVALERLDLVDPIRPASLPATGSIILTLAFMSAVLSASYERLRAQRSLLFHQSTLLEDALDATIVEETTLRSIMNVVPFGVVTFDAEGAVTHSNHAARDLFSQFDVGASTAWSDIPLFGADGATRLRTEEFPLSRALRGEEVVNQVVWLGHRDGPRIAADVSAQLIMRPDGSIDRVVLVMRDLTEQLAAERRRDDMVTSLSHEFRTPLSSILGYLDLALEDDQIGDGTRERIEVARRNSERLQALVGDLLVTRAGEARAADVERVQVDLAEIARDAAQSLEPVAADRGVQIVLSVPKSALVEGDSFRLRQVLDNVVSNAIKYNRRDGLVEMAIRHDPETRQQVLSIRDTGPGMSAYDLAHLFEPFYRSETARGSATAGTGLGLTICREIIEQHDGSIAIESAVDEGTTVTIRLAQLDGARP